MPFESPQQNNEVEQAERRRHLKENFGVVLCTKQKNGGTPSIEDQARLAEEMGLPAVQFDFRNRSLEELEQARKVLHEYRSKYPESTIDIHGDSPQINEQDLSMKTAERTITELELLQEVGGAAYTVHPPSINSKVFTGLPQEKRELIIGNYCEVFIKAIVEAIKNNKQLNIAIENMPVRGDEGAYGQTIEEIMSLIKKIQSELQKQGIDIETANKYIGVTLDVNHALHGAEGKDNLAVLENWFKGLGEYLRVIHLYTPSEAKEEFVDKYKTTIDLAAKYSPHAQIFLESKQNPEITKKVYAAAKEIDIK